MKMWTPGRLRIAAVLLIVGLPLAGKWARRTQERRCDLDGARIDRLFRVRILDAQNREHEFCGIHCARLWLSRQPAAPVRVLVTDEAGGAEIDAAGAWFVRSTVVTTAHTRNRIHVFQAEADAVKHAGTAHGKILTGSENPFATAIMSSAAGQATHPLFER
ncbi:MAG TPA: hypothetical protein VG099_19665 [Gemmataceae bacterium]|jgi:hypothetical protein|nr:hypothetical protein [Gemmataceae bacterium]